MLNLHYLWVGPLQASVIIIFLWYEIGPSCLTGVAAIALLMPVQTWFGKLFGVFRWETEASFFLWPSVTFTIIFYYFADCVKHFISLRKLKSLLFCRSKTAVLTDSRIRIMNEVVSGIRIIKMYAWEKPLSALITDVRRWGGTF